MRATRDHRRAWELIPWYVNGTLDAAERDLVEMHLEDCRECRAEVDLCRRLVEAGGRPEDLAPAPHPAQLERLISKIATESEAPAETTAISRPAAFLRRMPAWARAAAAVLALFLAGGAGYFVAPVSQPIGPDQASPDPDAPAEFRTLSDPETDPGAHGETPVTPAGPALRVVFAPATPEREIRELLLEAGAEIVGGPSPLGVYTVRPNARGERADPIPVVLQHLRSQPQVRFAEAVGAKAGAATDAEPAEPAPGGSRERAGEP